MQLSRSWFNCSVEISEELEVSMAVVESCAEDSGEYAVRLYNEFGEITSTTRVVVLFEAPSFVTPPSDCSVAIGDQATFEAAFRGVPAPRVTWLVSGADIVETEKYHVQIESYESRLTIDGVTTYDADVTYTCHVVNAAGEMTSSARITISGYFSYKAY
jgi:Immunoglobulin I-set domain